MTTRAQLEAAKIPHCSYCLVQRNLDRTVDRHGADNGHVCEGCLSVFQNNGSRKVITAREYPILQLAIAARSAAYAFHQSVTPGSDLEARAWSLYDDAAKIVRSLHPNA